MTAAAFPSLFPLFPLFGTVKRFQLFFLFIMFFFHSSFLSCTRPLRKKRVEVLLIFSDVYQFWLLEQHLSVWADTLGQPNIPPHYGSSPDHRISTEKSGIGINNHIILNGRMTLGAPQFFSSSFGLRPSPVNFLRFKPSGMCDVQLLIRSSTRMSSLRNWL